MDAISAIKRLEVVRNLMTDHDCSTAVMTHLPDIRWMSGFSGSNAIIVVTQADAVLLTDPRYEQQIVNEVVGIRAACVRGNLVDNAVKHIAFGAVTGAGVGDSPRINGILLDPHTTTATILEALRSLGGEEALGCKLVDSWLARARATKTGDELAIIRRAQAITDDVFAQLLDLIVPGISELEVNAEIVYRHLLLGADRMSFDPIVASGPNGALPHARPTNRKLQHGDLVVIDMGCILDGYASDMTRTIAIGQPKEEAARAYSAVKVAQAAAIEAAHAGIIGCDLDKVARESLKRDDLDLYFVHSLGHGVGLEVHEWPRVSSISDDVIPESCIVTIEPGVYLPGEFGVRIEDMIVMRENGCENLTVSSRELFVVE